MILSDGSARYVYGHERLFGDAGSARTWYLGDALGSVRATLDDAGAPLAGARYDPWGAPVTAAIAPFGFTGELQQGNEVYLRARWYDSARGAFGSRDPFAGEPEQPYSLHPYQYGYAAPTIWTDPSGQCVAWGNRECDDIRTWADFVATFEYQLTITDAATAGRAAGTTPREMAEYAAWYSVIAPQAEQYALDDPRFLQAEVFASYLLHESLVMQRMRDPAVLIAERDYLDQLACQRDLTSSEAWRHLHILTILGGMQFAEDEAGGGGGGRNLPGDIGSRLPLWRTGKVRGILDTGSEQIDLVSGRSGPAANMPADAPGMRRDMFVRDHVEAHAAAIMRQRGLKEATLYINKAPCIGNMGCDEMLSHMLPEGSTLNVRIKVGENQWEVRTYRGLPDSDWRWPR